MTARTKSADNHVPFNFSMGLLHGIFFRTGMAFSEPNSVLPVFLRYFTSSQTMIGFFLALMRAGGVLPQLFVARILQLKKRQKPLLVAMIWLRAAFWLSLGILAYFCPSGRPTIVLVALVTLFFGFSFAGGVANIPFTVIWGKVLPPTLRGRFFGHRQLWGGLMAIGAGLAVKRILGNPDLSFPKNYAYLFFLSFAFIAVSYIALSHVREPEGRIVERKTGMTVFLKNSIRLLRQDRNFSLMIAVQLTTGTADLALPFYVLYGRDNLHMAAEQVGYLIVAQAAGAILSNLLWGHLSDRIGNRIVIITTAATAALAPLLALLAHGVGWQLLIVVFILIGSAISGRQIGFMNYLLEIAPERLRPTYVALRGTFQGLIIVMPMVGGLLIDVFSYSATFLVALAGCAISLLLSLRLKKARLRIS